jgi:hypothetical protein
MNIQNVDIQNLDYIRNIETFEHFKHNIMYYISENIKTYIREDLHYSAEDWDTYMASLFEEHLQIVMNDWISYMYLTYICNDNTSIHEKLEKFFYYYKQVELQFHENTKPTLMIDHMGDYYIHTEQWSWYEYFHENDIIFPFIENLFNPPAVDLR